MATWIDTVFITAFNAHERELLYGIQESYEHAYFLNGVTNEASTSIDVVVDSCCIDDFVETLLKYEVEFTSDTKFDPYPSDYGSARKIQHKNLSQTFLDWDDILMWVDDKVKENTALTKMVIAKTYEHRDVFVLKLSSKKTSKKMSVFIVAGEEGRDWLSSALLLNYIDRILESSSNSETLLNFYDIYFVPILNPDGFVYTKTKDRMWAKNRRVIQPIQTCDNFEAAVGVNIDRNWFNEVAGYKSLSEEETQGLAYILNSIALKLLAFINLKGFGNLIVLPYADHKISSNNEIVMEIMKHTSAVLNIQYNKSYPVGTMENYFYNYTGNMPDWVKSKLNIPVVYTVYMQHNNFLPEESHILQLIDHLESLLNISLVISKEMYGSLYNKGVSLCTGEKYSIFVFTVTCFLCIFIK